MATKKERTERERRRRRYREQVLYRTSGYGWGTPGWTAQQAPVMNEEQFGTIENGGGEMTSTVAGGDGGGAGGSQ